MKGSLTTFNGVWVIAYILDINEKIPWHSHHKPHGHVVLTGRTKVEIGDQEPFEMTLGMPNVEMPARVMHQITALEPATVCIHISVGDPNEQ